MLLMLQSAARQSKETLRFFRDRGNVLGFLPREDDIDAHWDLLQQVPNLDAYTQLGHHAEEARATRAASSKSSLGNVMRLLRPMVVIDEGHHAYTENGAEDHRRLQPLLHAGAVGHAAGGAGKRQGPVAPTSW
jgi:type III restriction enzyme